MQKSNLTLQIKSILIAAENYLEDNRRMLTMNQKNHIRKMFYEQGLTTIEIAKVTKTVEKP